MSELIKSLGKSELLQAGLWSVAFLGVCVLVGLGKIKPETIEMLLFAIVGRASVTGGSNASADRKRL